LAPVPARPEDVQRGVPGGPLSITWGTSSVGHLRPRGTASNDPANVVVMVEVLRRLVDRQPAEVRAYPTVSRALLGLREAAVRWCEPAAACEATPGPASR
jgi:hypothetical protein